MSYCYVLAATTRDACVCARRRRCKVALPCSVRFSWVDWQLKWWGSDSVLWKSASDNCVCWIGILGDRGQPGKCPPRSRQTTFRANGEQYYCKTNYWQNIMNLSQKKICTHNNMYKLPFFFKFQNLVRNVYILYNQYNQYIICENAGICTITNYKIIRSEIVIWLTTSAFWHHIPDIKGIHFTILYKYSTTVYNIYFTIYTRQMGSEQLTVLIIKIPPELYNNYIGR